MMYTIISFKQTKMVNKMASSKRKPKNVVVDVVVENEVQTSTELAVITTGYVLPDVSLSYPIVHDLPVVINDESVIEGECEVVDDSPVDFSDEKFDELEVNEFQVLLLTMIEELGWEEVYNLTQQKSTVQIVTKGDNKVSKTLDIYLEMREKGFVRKDIIKEFMDKCNMSEKGAATYYQNHKKSMGH